VADKTTSPAFPSYDIVPGPGGAIPGKGFPTVPQPRVVDAPEPTPKKPSPPPNPTIRPRRKKSRGR
jgi:hypothetical protein